MSIETFDWQGYMSDIGYAPEQIPNEINDEDREWLYGLWARDLMEQINYEVKQNPFFSTAKEKASEARRQFLQYAPDLSHLFGEEVQPNDPNTTFDPEAFRQHVVNNEVQNANLGYYLDTFAASRINDDTDVKYPWLKGLTKDQFKKSFMEQQDIDEAWTSVDDIRNGNFGTLAANYQAQLAQQQGLRGDEKSGHMAALKQGWYEFEKLFGYTAGTLGDATGIQWLSDIGNEIAQNVIQKSDAYNYQSKYNQSLADTIKNEGVMAAGGKILNMAEENWATTAAPLALAAIGKILSTYAHVPQPLANAATRAVAANVVRRQGANLLRRASQLAYGSSMALSGLEIGGVRAELEEKGKYDPNNVADVVAAGLVSSSLDFIGNVAAMKGLTITAGRLWRSNLATMEARSRLAKEIAEDQAKSFTRRVLSAMATEGVTEGLQEIPAMVVGARRGIEYTSKEVRDRIIDAAAVGAFMGGGIRTGEIMLEKYHRGDEESPTDTDADETPDTPDAPEAPPQLSLPEPSQPPPPGFDGEMPFNNVRYRQTESGFVAADPFNVGYGATRNEAAEDFLKNANKGRVDIDANDIQSVPSSATGEGSSIVRYGNNGEHSVRIIGQGSNALIRKIIDIHNNPKNAVNLQGHNTFNVSDFQSTNPDLNEDQFIRSVLEQKKTGRGSSNDVILNRTNAVDIPVNLTAVPRTDIAGSYAAFNLDQDSRDALRSKGFTILSNPKSRENGRIQKLLLYRNGFVYTVTLRNSATDDNVSAVVEAEHIKDINARRQITNKDQNKKARSENIKRNSLEAGVRNQTLRVVTTDPVTDIRSTSERKSSITIAPVLHAGFVELNRKVNAEGVEEFTIDPRKILEKRIKDANGKIEKVGARGITYTSGGETTRLDITADGRVVVSTDGRFVGDYEFFDPADLTEGERRASFQSTRIEATQPFNVIDIPEELQFDGRVTFVYEGDANTPENQRNYYAIRNNGDVYYISPAEDNYIKRLLRLQYIQNLNDARDVFGNQFIEFYALPEFYEDGEVRQFVGFKTENNLLPVVNLEDPTLHRFSNMEVDDLISTGYNGEFVKVYAIIAPNGEVVRATTEEGVDAFIEDIKGYANILDDSEWNPSSRGESIFGDAYIEQGRYTERDIYSAGYEVPFSDEGVSDIQINEDNDNIRKAIKEVVDQIKIDLRAITKFSEKNKSPIAKKYIEGFKSVVADLEKNFDFSISVEDANSQFLSGYLGSTPREFNEILRRRLYAARTAQAMLHIDSYRSRLSNTINHQELKKILDGIRTYNDSDTTEQLRQKAIQAESIAIRLEEAYIDRMRNEEGTQIKNLLWQTIYSDPVEGNYGSFVNRIHSEGTDFRFSRAAETPRVRRKDSILNELQKELGDFTLDTMLEKGLRGESGGLVILPDQEAAHNIERMFTTDATQPYYDNAGLIQGFVAPDGMIYLVEDGIVDGKARQIILHEYGVHARKFGMTDAQFQEVVQNIKAKRDEKSVEGDFVRKCITRAKQANKNMSEDNPIFWEEVAAYAVEDGYHLADTGIVGRMQTWMKNWLWRFGVIDATAFHYQDFVNMAQGMLGNPGPLSFFDGTHDYTKYQDSWKNIPKFSRTILAEDTPDREEFAQRTYRRLRGLDDAIDRERNGEDADTIEQATDWRRNDNGDWNFRYSIAGEIGAARLDALEEVTTRMDNLVVARDMEQAGKDTKAIKFATGWYRGKDGKWRYEISNNLDELTDKFEEIALRIVSYDVHRYFNKEGIAPYYIEKLVEKEGKGDFLRNIADSYEPLNPGVIFNKANYKMSEIFSSPDLFAAYPELADMTVYITGILFGYNTVAFYSTDDKTITLNEGFVTGYILDKLGLESVRVEDMRNSLLHEIQHYIQDVEGFSRGTSVRYLEKKLEDSESYAIIKPYEDEIDKIKEELRDRDKTYLNKYRYYMSRIYYLLFLDFINNSDNYHFNDDGVLVRNSDNKSVTIGDSGTFYTFGIDQDEIITRDNLKSIIDRVSEKQFHSFIYLGNPSEIFDNPGRAIIRFTDFDKFVKDNFNDRFGEEEKNFLSELKEKEERLIFLQDKINEEYTKFFGREGITSPNAAYRASIGESEARMVEKRSTLTSEELRDRYIEEDLDVPLENQINTDVFYDEVISDSLVRYSRATAEELKPYSSFINTLENDLVSQRISGVPNEGDTVLYQRGDVNEFITRDSLYTIEDADDYYPDLEQRWIDYHRDDSESNFVRYSRSIPETNGFRYSFAGEIGAAALDAAQRVTTRIDNLRIAHEMEAAGKDTKDIWIATGWERGKDGKWRFEIGDYGITLKDKFKGLYRGVEEGSYKLSDIINHRNLFVAYPFLKNVNVEMSNAEDEYHTDIGVAEKNDRGEDVIRFRSINFSENYIKEKLLHEIQHLIQDKEGFATGGMPWDFIDFDSEDYKKDEILSYNLAFLRYTRLAGEVEARNVEERMHMSPAERKYLPPLLTEDVAREDQIILENMLEEASSAVSYSRSVPTGMQKQAGVIYPNMGEEISSFRYSIGKAAREEYRTQLEVGRRDFSPEQIENVLKELDKYHDAKQYKKVKAALHWVIRGRVILPEDEKKIEEAIKTAENAKVDLIGNLKDYESPLDFINKYKEFKPKTPPIDPSTVPEFSDPLNLGDGIITYEVQDTKEGQQAMREIINTHWGEDANPWCLLQGDGKGNLTSDSWTYWSVNYTGLPKRVAFKNGKLLSFMATNRAKDTTIETSLTALKNWISSGKLREVLYQYSDNKVVSEYLNYSNLVKSLDFLRTILRRGDGIFVYEAQSSYGINYLRDENLISEDLRSKLDDAFNNQRGREIFESFERDKTEWLRAVEDAIGELITSGFNRIRGNFDRWLENDAFKISYLDDSTAVIIDESGKRIDIAPLWYTPFSEEFRKQSDGTFTARVQMPEQWWDRNDESHPNLDWARDTSVHGLRYSRAATIDDVPQTARQRGTQVPNAPGMYKMLDGSLHIEPSELPIGFESETILYAAIAISDPAKEEPKIAELRGLIAVDEDLMRETDRMMRERNDTNEDHRLGYAVSLILEAYDPTSDIYQQTVDAFHEAVSKATGGAYQNLILDTGQIEAAAHAAAGIPYEALLTAPQETVPTPRPDTADVQRQQLEEAFANSDAQREYMQVGEDGRPFIATDDSDVDVVFESKVTNPFTTGELADKVLVETTEHNEPDDFYNHLADSPHHGTQEPLDTGNFTAQADTMRNEVEAFLASVLPEHIWNRMQILWEDNAENRKLLNNALGNFNIKAWQNKNILVRGWDRSFGQVVRTAAREASRFGWGLWQNRDFRKALTDFYDMFTSAIYNELTPYYNQMGVTDPTKLTNGQKIFMVQTFFSKLNQSLFTDDATNMADILGIDAQEYKRVLANVKRGISAQENDLSRFMSGVAGNPELAKQFASEMLRMTMETATNVGTHFVYERANTLGGRDRIRVCTNEWGTWRNTEPKTRFGKVAKQMKENLEWWHWRYKGNPRAEKFARWMMRNAPVWMKYPFKWMHLYVPDARLGDTTLGKASQMISRVWQRIGDMSGTTIQQDYALMEDIHGILRDYGYDPLVANDMFDQTGRRITYEQFFRSLGITSAKAMEKARLADEVVRTAEGLRKEQAANIRSMIVETGVSLYNRMVNAGVPQRNIQAMVNDFERKRQKFHDNYAHRMYEAFTPEGKSELARMLHYLKRDPATGELSIAKRARRAQEQIRQAEARYGRGTSQFYKETAEARADLRRYERLAHLWNFEMAVLRDKKRLFGAELNEAVVTAMKNTINTIILDAQSIGRIDAQAVPHYNSISAQKARKLNPENDVHRELMAFLSEIKDPMRVAVYSADQQRQIIAKLQFNKELGEYLVDNGMATIRGVPSAEGIARDLAQMESGTFLEYINVDPAFMPEIKAEYENMQKVTETVLGGLTDAVKANSTVYSLRLAMNNYIGNASMLLASGHFWRFGNWMEAGGIVRKQFLDRFTYGAKDPSDFGKMIIKEMEDAMVTGGSGTEMSVFQLNKGAHENFVQMMTGLLYSGNLLSRAGKFKADNFVKRALEYARKFYTYGDEWVKPLMYINNRMNAIAKYEAIEKRRNGETEEEYKERVLKKAIEEASEMTIRETVSWENSPFMVRQLSTKSTRFFVPDFLLHNFQMLRITASNYVRLMELGKELANFNPTEMNSDKVDAYRSALKKEFAQRSVGGAMTAGVYAGLAGATGSCMAFIPYMMNTLMAAIDGEDDKDKDNTFFNPQEWEGAQRILNYKTGGDNFFVPAWKHNGKIYAWNYGRASVMLTHAIPQPATENPEFTDYAAQFFKNIVNIGGGTIAQEIVNNAQGKDKWGREIGMEAGWGRIFDRVIVPGAVRQLLDMSVGYPGSSDNPYREGKAIKMSDAVGITVNAYDMRDIVNEVGWNMGRVGSNSQNVARKSFVKRLTESDALSDSQIASLVSDMRESNARDFDKANYVLTGLRQMGMENKEIAHWLTVSRKDANTILSKKQANAFLKGQNIYDENLVTYLKNKRNNLAKGQDDVRMSKEELAVVLQNYDKAIRIYSQALRTN